jgi:ribosomal-protein-alanine N-acetyltransferase
MSFLIQKAIPSDVPSLVALEHLVFKQSDWPLNKRSFGYHVRGGKNLMLTAKETTPTGSILGYVLVLQHRRSARIYSLATCPEHRGLGIGKALAQEAIHRVLERGILNLSLELRESNTPALQLYRSLGFTVSGIRPGFYRQEEDAITMTLRNPSDHSGESSLNDRL